MIINRENSEDLERNLANNFAEYVILALEYQWAERKQKWVQEESDVLYKIT